MERQFDVITFDCYGTLIDWETGIIDAFESEASARDVSVDPASIMAAYMSEEPAVEAERYSSYREVLEETGVQVAIGRLIGVYSDPGMQVIEYPDGRRVQAVNLCFEARPLETAEPTTPEETLATGYFAPDALPEPLVPIHAIRIRDALDGDRATRIR